MEGARPAMRRSRAPDGLRPNNLFTRSVPCWAWAPHREPELLTSCYERSIALAAAHGCTRVALPAISTGAFGYPLEQAAQVSLAAAPSARWKPMSPSGTRDSGSLSIRFTFDVFADRLQRITGLDA